MGLELGGEEPSSGNQSLCSPDVMWVSGNSEAQRHRPKVTDSSHSLHLGVLPGGLGARRAWAGWRRTGKQAEPAPRHNWAGSSPALPGGRWGPQGSP